MDAVIALRPDGKHNSQSPVAVEGDALVARSLLLVLKHAYAQAHGAAHAQPLELRRLACCVAASFLTDNKAAQAEWARQGENANCCYCLSRR